METALLATLYGTVIANMIATPIADKLHVKLEEEEISRTLMNIVLKADAPALPNGIKP